MKKIEHLIEVDERYQEDLLSLVPKIETLGESNGILSFSNLISVFVRKLNFLKNGIRFLIDDENIYSIKILLRTLIEHYIKFYYLLLYFKKESAEDFAKEIIEYSGYVDAYDYGTTLRRNRDLLKANFLFEPFPILQEQYPKLKKMKRREFTAKIDRHRLNGLKKLIIEKLIKDNDNKSIEFFVNLFNKYSELSSFIHGGIGADSEMFMYSEKEKRQSEIYKSYWFSLEMSVAAGLNSVLLFSIFDETLNVTEVKFKNI
jgi:hypothetical protein